MIRANLAGVQRVFLSGGEPLLRRDLPEIVDMYSEFIIGLPTNATRGLVMAPRLAGKVAFVNIGFDGPRATFSRVRGDYDKAMTGVRAFMERGCRSRCRRSCCGPRCMPCRTCTRSLTCWTRGS